MNSYLIPQTINPLMWRSLCCPMGAGAFILYFISYLTKTSGSSWQCSWHSYEVRWRMRSWQGVKRMLGRPQKLSAIKTQQQIMIQITSVKRRNMAVMEY